MDSKPKYYNEKRNEAAQKYHKNHMEQLAVRVYKGGRDELQRVAKEAGMSMVEYICEAVNARAGRLVISSKADEWAAVIAQNELEADMQAVVSENLPAWKELANDQSEDA